MLVLTRKTSQAIKLGENITITVMRTTNGSVRLGIDAPPDVRIRREELEELEETSPSQRRESALHSSRV